MEFQIFLKISVFSEFLFFEFIQAVSHASLALHQEFSFFFEFQIFSGFPLLPEGKMKIHLQTKRGLNTLKFGACSEILTLILRGKLKSGA